MEQEKGNQSQQNIEEITGTTVLIEMEYALEGYNGRGSGFFIESDRIVTNVHVLAGASKITAKCVDTETVYTIEGIIAFDDINDLAVLKIAEEGTPFPLGDSNTLRKGEQVYVIGCPKGKVNTVEGSVHSIRNSGKQIFIDSHLDDGHSGGPVLNTKGGVIAVAQGVRISSNNSTRTTNSSRTISSNVLKSMLEKTGEVVPLEVWQEYPQIHAYVIDELGDVCRERGEYRQAIAHYDTALKLNPDLIDIYHKRSLAKFSIEKNDDATTDLLIALRLSSEQFSFSGFGVFLESGWNVIRIFSLSFFLRSIKSIMGKDNWLAVQGSLYCKCGKELFKQENIAEARNLYRMGIDNFTEAINQRPKKATFYNGRGWTKYMMGQLETEQGNTIEAERLYQEAVDDANSALQLIRKSTGIRRITYHTRGAAKAGLGDHNAAIEDFNECIRLKPKKKKALYYQDRGLSKQALGQQDAAEVDFAKAKEIDSDVENKSWD